MYKIIVAGGGSASVATVGHILRNSKIRPEEILVIEPSPQHFYQPGYTMIGGGLLGDNKRIISKSINTIQQQTKVMFNPRVHLLPKEVTGFDPENNSITASNGQTYQYQNLIVTLGIKLDYESIPGLIPALNAEDSPVGTIYSWEYALKTNRLLGEFQGGKAIFSQANMPMKCAGAPQKIMYLAHERFKKGKISNFDISFYKPQEAMFSQPDYAKQLIEIATSKGIKIQSNQLLTKIEPEKRLAYFKNPNGEISIPYDFLHIVPPHTSHSVIKNSKLADATGYVNVNPNTTQHITYKNV